MSTHSKGRTEWLVHILVQMGMVAMPLMEFVNTEAFGASIIYLK